MKYLNFLLLICFVSCSSPDNQGSGKKPNIVLILADDLGYGDVGCYGCTDTKTPNIDRLSEEGVRFTNFYSNGPECTPTRTALLSGRYQQRIGGLECALGAGNVARYDEAEFLWRQKELGLPPEENLLTAGLKKNGYHTAMMGKWHLGYEKKFRPDNQGFDYSFGNIGYGGDYFYHTEQASLNLDDFTGSHNLAADGKEIFRDGRYMTDLITEEAVNWIAKQDKNNPFFLYLPFTAPHVPYQGPDDNPGHPLEADGWNSGTRDTYVEMVEALDQSIGVLLAALEKQNFVDETVVIFFSDNGGTKMADNGILSGTKGTVLEGGIRVPCIIKWPGKIREGIVSDQPTISFDLTCSVLKLAGEDSGSPGLDGYDIVDHIIQNKTDFDRTLFWRIKREKRIRKAVRKGDLKYLVDLQNDTIQNEKLFDLKNDPSELHDLSTDHPEEVKRLKEELSGWEKEVVAPRLKDFRKN